MKKKHSALMRKIYLEVPLELRQKLMVKVNKYAVAKEAMELAIKDPEFPEEKKGYYRNAIEAGHMDVMEDEVDPEVAQQIDDYINTRVLEEVKKGNLPKVAEKEVLKTLKKTRKHARKEGDRK